MIRNTQSVRIGSRSVVIPNLARTDGRVSRQEVTAFRSTVVASNITVPEIVMAARELPLGGPKSLLEHCAAKMVGRPIIGGVADPTKEDIASFISSDRWMYRTRWFERSGRIYERLFIPYFERFLSLYSKARSSLYKKAHPDDSANARICCYTIGHIRNIQTLADYELETRQSEAIHVLGNVLTLPMSAFITVCGTMPTSLLGVALFAGNIFGNIYPIMLQRYNRARIGNTIDLKLGRGPFKID